jgi:NTP pyrophosphatase (non-canonical NTP hydrolase)
VFAQKQDAAVTRAKDQKVPSDPPASILVDEYQDAAARTDKTSTKGFGGIAFLLLGLFGEVGTLLSALKKKQRDQAAYVGYSEAVMEELGDVLWYFSNIASHASLRLSVIAQLAHSDFDSWNDVEVDSLATFQSFQGRKTKHGSPNSPEFEHAIMLLAGKVGLLLNDFSLGRLAKNRDALSAHLVEVFRTLAKAAHMANVDLQTAAASNVRKINSRWPAVKNFTTLFDDGFPVTEQLPRKIKMHITEELLSGKAQVVQRWNGVKLGNSLTDNKIASDDYRFHDVFHLAYAAILGWSPVIRALLKAKRKSVPEIDNAEDGARAILIEEGVSTLIFHHALRLDCFTSIESLDYPLLKTVQEFVRGFEVEVRPLWQWERAILEGFKIFRRMRSERRGIVVADLVNRTIRFTSIKS